MKNEMSQLSEQTVLPSLERNTLEIILTETCHAFPIFYFLFLLVYLGFI